MLRYFCPLILPNIYIESRFQKFYKVNINVLKAENILHKNKMFRE